MVLLFIGLFIKRTNQAFLLSRLARPLFVCEILLLEFIFLFGFFRCEHYSTNVWLSNKSYPQYKSIKFTKSVKSLLHVIPAQAEIQNCEKILS